MTNKASILNYKDLFAFLFDKAVKKDALPTAHPPTPHTLTPILTPLHITHFFQKSWRANSSSKVKLKIRQLSNTIFQFFITKSKTELMCQPASDTCSKHSQGWAFVSVRHYTACATVQHRPIFLAKNIQKIIQTQTNDEKINSVYKFISKVVWSCFHSFHCLVVYSQSVHCFKKKGLCLTFSYFCTVRLKWAFFSTFRVFWPQLWNIHCQHD